MDIINKIENFLIESESDKHWTKDRKYWQEEVNKLPVVDDDTNWAKDENGKTIALWFPDRGEGWFIKKLIKEASSENQKLVKKILPSGFISYNDNEFIWKKTGGYSGKKTLETIRKKAESLGFKRDENKATGNADGSYVGNVIKYSNENNVVLSISSSFGVTKERNNYYASLKFNKDK